MNLIQILIADHKHEFIEAATRFLDTEPRLSVIGQAASGLETVAQAAALQPDLILLDYRLPGMKCDEVIRQIKARPDAPRIVILAEYNLPEYRVQAKAAGADGLVTRLNLAHELLPLIETLFSRSTMAAETEPEETNPS